jgi:5-methyltetrahydropteroyltriglutamate--homocysteine methyltransferase
MTTQAKARVARADVVGSLLRPAYLREARQGCAMEGRVRPNSGRCKTALCKEVIAFQESIGLDVITDGEIRREGWNAPLA